MIGAGTSSFDGAYSSLTGKPTIPTNNNQLTNGAGYITSSQAGVTSIVAGDGIHVNRATGAVTVTNIASKRLDIFTTQNSDTINRDYAGQVIRWTGSTGNLTIPLDNYLGGGRITINKNYNNVRTIVKEDGVAFIIAGVANYQSSITVGANAVVTLFALETNFFIFSGSGIQVTS